MRTSAKEELVPETLSVGYPGNGCDKMKTSSPSAKRHLHYFYAKALFRPGSELHL